MSAPFVVSPEPVHVVLPNDIDDPAAPSGGNRYDRRLCQALAARGWTVHEHAAYGNWPQPSAGDRDALARLLAALPDAVPVLIDGLIASAVPEVLLAQASRLRLVVLVHLPLGETAPAARPAERAALLAAAAIVTTSQWARQRLFDLYGLPADRVHAAPPGVDPAPRTRGTATGAGLLCVAAVSPHKGHDLLMAALATLAELDWTCVCAGPLDREPAFVAELREGARAAGIADRVSFPGPLTGAELDARWAAADLLVLASRGETYGMVVTEALARGTPVLATEVGGLPEALGRAPDGSRPGILVPPNDPGALANALRRWLVEPELRDELRRAAAGRSHTLTGWSATAVTVHNVLSAVTAKVSVGR